MDLYLRFLNLQLVISAFPKVTASEITTIYYEVHKSDDKAEDVKISIE